MTRNYFKKGIALYFLGNFSSKLISLLLLPLFTFYLTQEEFGLFDILNSVVLFLVPVVGAQIYEGIIRYLLEEKQSDKKEQIITTSFIFLILSTLAANVILLLVNLFYAIPFLYWFLVYLDLYIINFYLQRVSRGLQLQKEFAFSGVINTVIIALLSSLLLIGFDFKVAGLLIAYAGGSFGSIIYLLIKIHFSDFMKSRLFDGDLLKRLLFYSVPLLFDAVIWWTMNLSDRLILGYIKGTGDVGIYGVANKFAALLTFANHIFYLVWQEFAIIRSKQEGNKEEFSKIFEQYLKVQFTGVLLMMPVVKMFINFFIDPSFQSAFLYVPLLLFSAMFSSFAAFYGLFYQIDENTKGALYTSAIAGVLNIVLNFVFIPTFGIWAAAASTLLSFALLWFIRIIKFQAELQLSQRLFSLVVAGTLLTTFSILLFYQLNIILDIVNIVIAGTIFIVVNRSLFKKIFKTV